MPGSSGRLRKNSDGSWEWSDEEVEERPEKLVQVPVGICLHHTQQNLELYLTGECIIQRKCR